MVLQYRRGAGGHLGDVSVEVTVQALGVERALGRVVEGDVGVLDGLHAGSVHVRAQAEVCGVGAFPAE